jgi:hypothetical protein
MAKNTAFHHPHDTTLSALLRFLSELIAWIAGAWLIASYNAWLVAPALLILVGLPSVFSTPGDKRQIIVATPGPVRVAIELFLFAVAAAAPWFVWPVWIALACVVTVLVTLLLGYPRMMWLLHGASRRR